MSINLGIGFYHWVGVPITTGLTSDIFYGGRTITTETSSAVTASYFDFARSSAEIPDFCFLTAANIMAARDVGGSPVLKVQGSAFSDYHTILTYSLPITTSNLSGPNGEDLLFYDIAVSAFQYWRVRIETTSSVYHKWSGLYFGQSFDFGRDPVFPEDLSRLRASKRDKRGAYRITLRYEDITLTKKLEFNSLIGKWADTKPVVLFSRGSYDAVTDDRITINCMIRRANWKITGWGRFDLSLELEELL